MKILQKRSTIDLSQYYKVPNQVVDTLAAEQELKRLLLNLQRNGYLAASIDSHEVKNDTLRAWLWKGNRYEWVQLRHGNVGEEMLKRIGYQSGHFQGEPVRIEDYKKLQKKLVQLMENNGYPFASVRLDSLILSDSTISAALNMEKHKRITFDTIELRGNANIGKTYLYNSLGIRPGNLYSQKRIDRISQQISDVRFLSVQKPTRVTFMDDRAKPVMFLKDQATSRVNFLVGVVPNSNVTGRLLITGEADMNFINPFGRGSQIKFQYEKLEGTTQELNAKLNYPYLLSLPFGADVQLELYKQDTSYLDLKWELGVEYLLGGGDYIKAIFNNQTTTVLTVDTTTVKATRTLPDNIDISRNLYGLEYQMTELNDPVIPTRGHRFRVKGGVGVKTIEKNNKIATLQDPLNPERNLEHLYDSLELKSTHIEAEATIDKFWPLSNRSTLKSSLNAAAIFSENLFGNELYRIGGNKLLRGFDDQSIRASLYTVGTLEYRFLLTPKAYFFSFVDGAYIENQSAESYANDFPFGFGVGLTFDSEAGIFNISYSLGSQQGNPIDLRSAKIHFGYVNYF